ncbi:hypothetical protein CK203_106560 [Vitis vinifera]|uniref:Uncharacterized protein n=1 Tax=Vitis vinifera TaxID=29760 RepID=A0A438DVD5_VITVI|nr:hypothetical protein CK203_106560 [Vitis vinifera]
MMDRQCFCWHSKLCGEPLKPCADSEGIQRGFELESRSKDKLNGFFYSKQGCSYTMMRRGPTLHGLHGHF